MLIMAGLGALTLLARLPFLEKVLFHWDSVNFAMAMDVFDLAKEQPQPPGYLLYVLLARLVNFLVLDPPLTLTLISAAASALAVPLIFALAKTLWGNAAGWFGALFLLSSPLFWIYGEIALPHVLDLTMALAAMGCFLQVSKGRPAFLLPGVFFAALAGGIRPQTLVFLLPAILAAMVGQRWQKWALAGALGGLLCLLWLAPLIGMSGGLSQYLAVTDQYSSRFMASTNVLKGAGWWGLTRNARKLFLYTSFAWGFPALAFLGGGIRFFLKRKSLCLNRAIAIFLAWLLAPGAYYLLVHMGQPGLVLLFLPVLVLASAWGAKELLRFNRILGCGLVAVTVALNGWVFLAAPEYPMGQAGQRLWTKAALVNNDAYFLSRFALIRERLDPQNTVIMAASWRHVEYYLPEYPLARVTVGSKLEMDAGTVYTPDHEITFNDVGLNEARGNAAFLVIFDPELERLMAHLPAESEKLSIPGAELTCVPWKPGQILRFYESQFHLIDP